ncbi:hypothetical protein [Arenibaculum sp.]|uniref:hypothetical protein n=1 Tax=Arenibaculum sp. TaxID=2865862 RepID=UPI002E13311E|nr:hypothetical protein [Arenibaculum sp.]
MIRVPVLFPALVAGLLWAASPGAGAAGPGFVVGIGDLPLMEGLVPVTGQVVLFDKPDGRIVQAVARGDMAPAEVRGFYARTLPQLGWRPAGPDRYARDGEVLALEFVGRPERRPPDRGPVTVRFILNPQ